MATSWSVRGDVIHIEVPMLSASLNRYAYSHWRLQHGDKTRWYRAMAAIVASGCPTAGGPRRVDVTRYGPRRIDPDNLVGGLKPVLDAMRAVRLIVDDDDKHLVLRAHNATPGTVIRGTVIEISPIAPDDVSP